YALARPYSPSPHALRPGRDVGFAKSGFRATGADTPIRSPTPIRVVILTAFGFDYTRPQIQRTMELLSWITDPSDWASLATLTCLEIVLGIDNLVFITIVTGKLPERDQPKARIAGLTLALLTRVLLLFCISWLTTLTATLFFLF